MSKKRFIDCTKENQPDLIDEVIAMREAIEDLMILIIGLNSRVTLQTERKN